MSYCFSVIAAGNLLSQLHLHCYLTFHNLYILYNQNYCIDLSQIRQGARWISILHKYGGKIVGWIEIISDFEGFETQTFTNIWYL